MVGGIKLKLKFFTIISSSFLFLQFEQLFIVLENEILEQTIKKNTKKIILILFMWNGMGIETGVAIEEICSASKFVFEKLGRIPSSRVYNALASKKKRIN